MVTFARFSWGPPSFLSNGHQEFFLWWKNSQGVKMTTYLHLVPRLRTHGAYIHSPIHLHCVVF